MKNLITFSQSCTGLPKMHKTPTGASKNCSAKPLSDRISKIFKMIFNIVERSHNKIFCYSGCKKLWVVQNYFLIFTNLNKINVKKKARTGLCYCHATYAFQSESTLYSCINVKELLARNRCDIWSLSDSNRIRTHNRLVRKPKPNHLAKLAQLSGCVSNPVAVIQS